MPLPTPSRSTVVWAFILGGFLLIGGLFILFVFISDHSNCRELPGTVKEHHWRMPFKQGTAVVWFWFDEVHYHDTIRTAPFTFFSDDEAVTLLFCPDAGNQIQIKGFWQQYWVPVASLTMSVPALGIAFWGRRRRKQDSVS